MINMNNKKQIIIIIQNKMYKNNYNKNDTDNYDTGNAS